MKFARSRHRLQPQIARSLASVSEWFIPRVVAFPKTRRIQGD